MEEGVQYWNTHVQKNSNQLPHWVKLYHRIGQLLPPDRNIAIADLGCLGGYFAEFVKKKGYRNLWGIDFAPVPIKMARKAVPEFKFTLGNLYDKKIQAEFSKYDVFVCIEIFQLLKNDLTVINAIPKGRLVILSVPNTNMVGSARYFKTAASVVQRYETMIDLKNVVRISRHRSSCFWLTHGVKA